jgi:hypothetical protein
MHLCIFRIFKAILDRQLESTPVKIEFALYLFFELSRIFKEHQQCVERLPHQLPHHLMADFADSYSSVIHQSTFDLP